MPDNTLRTGNTPAKPASNVSEQNKSLFFKIRWGESYVSLLLGAIVVIVAAGLGFFYVKSQQPKQELLPPATISRSITVSISPANPSVNITQIPVVSPPVSVSGFPIRNEKSKKKTTTNIYIVQKDDNLWTIAQKEYGSGYSWVSIARANNLINPGAIFSGNKLIIPSVTPILVKDTQKLSLTVIPTRKPTPTVTPTQTNIQSTSIMNSTYTVQRGDSLWNIAVRAYGDGYKWVTIAKVNNLTNPGLIHSGNVLQIPRK